MMRKASTQGWLIFGTGTLFVFLQLVLQTSPSVLHDGLVVDFSLSGAGFGTLSASFYYPYILLQVPSGFLVARYGPRRILMAGALICAGACVAFAQAPGIPTVTAARIVMGIGAAPACVCVFALASRWFPPQVFPLLVCLVEMAGMVGSAVGQELLGLLAQATSWRRTMDICGLAALVVFVLLAWIIRDGPARSAPVGRSRSASGFAALGSPAVLLTSLAGGLIASVGVAFALLWAVPFFQSHLQVDLSGAALCSSFYFWGTIPGLLLTGWLAGKLRRPDQVLMGGAVASGIILGLIIAIPPIFSLAALLMFLLGVFNASYAAVFPLSRLLVPDEMESATMGLANMMVMGIGSWIFQPVMGLMADPSGIPRTEALYLLLSAQVFAVLALLLARRMPAPTARDV